MANRYTMTYLNREAGQQQSGATLFWTDTDTHAEAVVTALAGFQVANAWKALNASDVSIPNTLTDETGTKEMTCIVHFTDNSIGYFHVPWCSMNKDASLLENALGIYVSPATPPTPNVILQNAAGHDADSILQVKEINFR